MSTSSLPIKYTLFPIYDYDKVLGSKKKDYVVKNIRIVGYAVSKCFIKEKRTIYLEDSENVKTIYRVLYPFKNYYFKGKDKLEKNNEEYEGEYVPAVFDDYEQANEYKTYENKKIRLEDFSLPKRKRIFTESYIEELDSKIEELESQIISETDDLSITKDRCKVLKNKIK